MKTIEQKAKAYDEALDRARVYWETDNDNTLDIKARGTMEHLFPELKESEDEKMMHQLHSWMKEFGGAEEYTEKVYTWLKSLLEKQGEQKPIINVPTREVIISIWDLGNEWKELTNGSISTEYGTQLDYIQKHWHESEYYLREKQGEQKVPVIDFKAKDWYVSKVDGKIRNIYHSVDKVEPKFKVGDWVASDYNNVAYIESISETKYNLRCKDGYHEKISIEYIDRCWHLWSIKDAKPGDVLCVKYGNDEMPFIFTGKQDDVAYCALNSFGEFVLSIAEWLLKISVLPATKEQRDLLFTKMKEAGFEWDSEKKELKKIEDEEYDGEDYGIDGLYHAQRILEKTLGKVNGYQTDDGILDHKVAIDTVKKLYEQKPTEWKQENVEELSDFENAMMHIGGSFFGENAGLDPNDTSAIKEQANLLLELVPKTEWSEEDEKRLKSCLNILQAKGFMGITETINTKWLKSLKQRYTWKPSDEQMRAFEQTYDWYNTHSAQNIALNSLYNDLKKLKGE